MKMFLWFACLALALSACGGGPLYATPYGSLTAVPSRTPNIQTATPVVLSPAPITATVAASTQVTESLTATLVPVTPTETLTATSPAGSVNSTILGCDTSIDILHGMGEVTNAYVKIINTTAKDVPELCATLYALDEGRPHPDKTKCLSSLPAGYQVTLKLTVDSTYKQNTPVQVDVKSGDSLLMRVGGAACSAIGVPPPEVDGLGTPQAIP